MTNAARPRVPSRRSLRGLATASRGLLAVLLLVVLPAAGCGPTTIPDTGPKPLPAATVPADQDEAARQFVLGFLDARQVGDRDEALRFLAPRAREQYAAEEGLRLVGDFESLALLDLKAADADSYEVRVRVDLAGGGSVEEYLFVGPGAGEGEEEMRPWIVRGAMPAP